MKVPPNVFCVDLTIRAPLDKQPTNKEVYLMPYTTLAPFCPHTDP